MSRDGGRYGLSALAMWVVLLVAVVLCGAVRETWVAPWLGEHRAHQGMTLAACAVVFGLIVGFVRVTGPSRRRAFFTGTAWLAMCLAFEFGFFYYVAGRPWEELLADYHVLEGRLLVLLWLTTWLGPWVAVRWWGGPDLRPK